MLYPNYSYNAYTILCHNPTIKGTYYIKIISEYIVNVYSLLYRVNISVCRSCIKHACLYCITIGIMISVNMLMIC